VPGTKRPMPPDGIDVSATDPYWHRRIIQGDVEAISADVDEETAVPPAIEPAQPAPAQG
jgi:Protein of unknown function (DUF2635)